MGQNAGFLAQNADLPLNKCQFGAASLAAAVAVYSLPPGNAAAAVTPPNTEGALVVGPSVSAPGTPSQQGLSYLPILSRIAVQFQASVVGGSITFGLFVKRAGVLSPIPGASAIVSPAVGNNSAFVDFSAAQFSTQTGDVISAQANVTSLLGAPLTDVMLAVG